VHPFLQDDFGILRDELVSSPNGRQRLTQQAAQTHDLSIRRMGSDDVGKKGDDLFGDECSGGQFRQFVVGKPVKSLECLGEYGLV
jgi:hypothetical protein